MSVMRQLKKQITGVQIPAQWQVPRQAVQELRQAVFAQGKMNKLTEGQQEMIAALRSQYEKVKDEAAWLDLKQSELRSDDEISFFGLLEARQNLDMERSLLAGHANMLQQELSAEGIMPDSETARMFQRIASTVHSR